MTIRPFTGDPLSACYGTPDACSQAHLYCFNRSPKEANVEAMHVFEATFDKTLKTAQAAINEATHGSVVNVAEAMTTLDAQVERIGDKIEAAIEQTGNALDELTTRAGSLGNQRAAHGSTLSAPWSSTLAGPDAQHYVDTSALRQEKDEIVGKEVEQLLGLHDDEIKRPDHYARFPIEPVTFAMYNDLPFWAANVVKYACRAPYKHETEEEDIHKLIRYAQMRLEMLKREREGTDGNVVGNPL